VDYDYRNDLGTSHSNYRSSYGSSDLYKKKFVFGPASKLDDKQLAVIADVYSVNHTRNYASSYSTNGYSNATSLRDEFILVNTYDEFSNSVRENWKQLASQYSSMRSNSGYSPYTTLKGGIWLGDEKTAPTLLVNARSPTSPNQMLNMYNVLTTGVGVSASYYAFAATEIPSLIDIKPLMFIIYYGLIMAWYVLTGSENDHD
jgi:hypothetical protein